MSYSLKHQITDLRQTNIQKLLESFFVFISISALSGLIQNLLVTYYYAGKQIFEEPALLKYISMTASVIPVLFFVYVFITNMARSKKIAQLKKEIALSTDCCGGNCGCNTSSTNSETESDTELAALEKLVDEAVKEAEKASEKKSKSVSKTKTAKKTSKKK